MLSEAGNIIYLYCQSIQQHPLTADRLVFAYAQAVSRAVLTPVTRMSFPRFINRFTWNSASLSRYADNQTPAVTAAMEAISKHIEGLENDIQAGKSIRGDFVSITGDRRELKLSTLAERKRCVYFSQRSA